jgi:hypothetical protein
MGDTPPTAAVLERPEHPETPDSVPTRPNRSRRGFIVWGSASSAVLVVLLLRNRTLFTQRMYADGDFAANGILIDKALRWRLLVGHYSRVGFHHPGPALLYIQAWSQWLFHNLLGVVPTPFNAQILGILILNAVLLGVTVRLIDAHQPSGLAAAAALVAIFIFAAREPYLLGAPWFPDVYFAPFLMFTVALASFLSGRWASLPWVCVGAGLLVHGHASFLGFVGPCGVVVLATVLIRDRNQVRSVLTTNRRTLLVSTGIIAIFAFPIVLNLALHWPGEFDKYFNYLSSGHAGGHSLSAAGNYAVSFWMSGAHKKIVIVLVVSAAIALVATTRPKEARRFEAWLLVMAALMTLLFLNYGTRGIDNLQDRYLGLFYRAVPAVVIAVIAAELATRLGRPARVGAVAVAVVVAIAGISVANRSPDLVNPYKGDARVPVVLARLRTASAKPGQSIVATFPPDAWPFVAALMYEGSHRGEHICARDPQWTVLVSSTFVCSPTQVHDGQQLTVVLAGESTPPGRVVFSDAATTLVEQS